MTKPLTSKSPHMGMPPLDQSGKQLSFFEFWPGKIFYLPVLFFSICLMLRYRSITLPSLANPSFKGGGFCGESKAEILKMLTDNIPDYVANFISHKRPSTCNIEIETNDMMHRMADEGLTFPIVAKPDLGCRGAGVQLIQNQSDLSTYIKSFPLNERIVFQRYIEKEGEAGIFYIRHPKQENGVIFSLTLKYFPYVYGDGRSTLKNLILSDKRAGRIPHLYLKRMTDHLDWIPEKDVAIRMVFSGSHSKGAIFRDGTHLVTDAMRQKIDDLSKRIPGFYFGRFDVRFDSFEDLQKGIGFTIVEVNGAGAEATHVWDRNVSLLTAWKTLIKQYKLAFMIGHENRQAGHEPISIIELYKMYKKESQLVPLYPVTH